LFCFDSLFYYRDWFSPFKTDYWLYQRNRKDINIIRGLYLLIFVCSIGTGLLSRSSIVTLPEFLSTYSGDVIWAFMVYYLFRLLYPQRKIHHVLILALIFSYLIELSQFYHAPWIDGLRYNRLGGLVLGYAFKFSDIVCYTVGVLLGGFCDTIMLYLISSEESGSFK